MIVRVAMAWSATKIWLEHGIGIGSDALHAVVGVIILAALHLILRRASLRLPWAGLFLIECANEMLDMSRPAGSVENDLGSSLHDLFLTMFLPTLLLFLWPALIRATRIKALDVLSVEDPTS